MIPDRPPHLALTRLEEDVLSLCMCEDWTSDFGKTLWRHFRAAWGEKVNDAPVRSQLWRRGFLTVEDVVTAEGKLALAWARVIAKRAA